MGRTRIHVTETVSAPLQVVFDQLADHEGMSHWPGVSACRLVAEGTPRNGVGAVRAVTARGLTLHEEIVRFDPPGGYDYSIIKGLPVDHLGRVRLTGQNGQTRIDWTVEMSSRIPLLAQIVGSMLRRGLPSALAYVKREAERAAQ